MSKIDYQALREKAEKATCGVWSLEYGEGRFDCGDALIHRDVVGYLAICRIEGAHPESGFDEDFQMEQQANAEFIAAANPATVLALLDELEAAENNLIDSECHGAELEESLRDKQALLESSEKRIAELSRHLQCAHDFIEHTEAFGYEASNGILCCGDAQWNIDSSKAALASAGSVNGEG